MATAECSRGRTRPLHDESMSVGRLLIVTGLVIAGLGALLLVVNRLNIPLGRLPGDVVWRGKNSTVYFPWVTCLVLSILGTLIMWLLNRRP